MSTVFDEARLINIKWTNRRTEEPAAEYSTDLLAVSLILETLKKEYPKAWLKAKSLCPGALNAPNPLLSKCAYISTIQAYKKEDDNS